MILISRNQCRNQQFWEYKLFVIDDFEIDFWKFDIDQIFKKRYFEINILQKKEFVKKMLRISLLLIFLIVSNAIFLESINQTSFLIKNILKLNYDFREKNI